MKTGTLISISVLSFALMAFNSQAQDKKDHKTEETKPVILETAPALPTARSTDVTYDASELDNDLADQLAGTKSIGSSPDLDLGSTNDTPLLSDALNKASNSLFPTDLSQGKSIADSAMDVSIEEDVDISSVLGQDTPPSTKAIYGRDERVELTRNRNSVDKRIGQLIIGNPFGQFGTCSGSLISPKHVLTAAHCVIDDNGRFMSGPIGFAPGRVEEYDPYGIYYAVRVYVLNAYKNTTSGMKGMVTKKMSASDLAVVELHQSPAGGALGYMPYKPFDYQTNRVTLTGYPGDKKSGSKWTTDCSYVKDRTFYNGLIVGTFCDAYQGMSGGPLLETGSDGSRRIVGVLSAGPPGQQIEGDRRNALLFAHLKQGNAFQWASTSNLWANNEIGTIDWPTVWANFYNLKPLLPATMDENQKNRIVSGFQSLTSVHHISSRKKYNYVRLRNACHKTIQVVFRVTINGSRQNLGVYNLSYNESIQLPNEDSTYYYWATSTDSDWSSKWVGNNPVSFQGHTLNMRYKSPTSDHPNFRSRVKLTCNN